MSDKELFEKLNRRMDFLKTEIIYTGKQSSDNYYYKEFKLNTYCTLAYNKTSKSILLRTWWNDGYGKEYDIVEYVREAKDYIALILEAFGRDYLLEECEEKIREEFIKKEMERLSLL